MCIDPVFSSGAARGEMHMLHCGPFIHTCMMTSSCREACSFDNVSRTDYAPLPLFLNALKECKPVSFYTLGL